MKQIFFALSTLLMISQSAWAGAFSDRARLATERSYQSQEEAFVSSAYQTNIRRMANYQKFINEHGGLRDAGDCFVRAKGACRPDIYFDASLLSCEQNNARSSFTGYNPSNGDVLMDCQFSLGDGLACKIDLTNELGQGPNRRAQCYDAAGNYREVGFTSSGLVSKGLPPSSKRR